ncbi:hypothetical protein CSUI_004522, partial [Cystoisospora suis]
EQKSWNTARSELPSYFRGRRLFILSLKNAFHNSCRGSRIVAGSIEERSTG